MKINSQKLMTEMLLKHLKTPLDSQMAQSSRDPWYQSWWVWRLNQKILKESSLCLKWLIKITMVM